MSAPTPEAVERQRLKAHAAAEKAAADPRVEGALADAILQYVTWEHLARLAGQRPTISTSRFLGSGGGE